MYKICIYNDNVETTIHYPSEDKEVPHLNKINIKEGLSQVDSLSFSIYINNNGYDKLYELTTKIKVIDTRDNSIRFTGRVLDVDEKMDSSGLFYKEVLCEGALSYFNDTKIRNTILASNTTDFLTQVLNNHNGKVDTIKQIEIGNVDVAGDLSINGEFKTSLEVMLEAKEKLGGDIRVRELNGILYLDWLQNFSLNIVDITLGINMKGIVRGKDITSLGTRIIPLGANNLTISAVNGGLDYIEDINSKNTYGIIEKTVEYREIEDAADLYNTCLNDLDKYTQPLYLLESNALDLSFLSGNKAEQFMLGVNLHIVNPVMAIDSIYKIVEIDLDLLKPYDPKLTIANFPIKLSTSINDLRKSSVQNNGVYNGVQVGNDFGIRVMRSDGKVVTTLNATEGISIENENQKVFFVDENGNLVANDATFNDVTANNMIANLMRTSNTNNYTVLHDQYLDFYNNLSKLGSIGYAPDPSYNGGQYDFGIITPRCSFTVYPGSGGFDLRSEGWNYFWGNCDFRGQVKSNGYNVATTQHISNLENTITNLQQRVFLLEQAVY